MIKVDVAKFNPFYLDYFNPVEDYEYTGVIFTYENMDANYRLINYNAPTSDIPSILYLDKPFSHYNYEEKTYIVKAIKNCVAVVGYDCEEKSTRQFLTFFCNESNPPIFRQLNLKPKSRFNSLDTLAFVDILGTKRFKDQTNRIKDALSKYSSSYSLLEANPDIIISGTPWYSADTALIYANHNILYRSYLDEDSSHLIDSRFNLPERVYSILNRDFPPTPDDISYINEVILESISIRKSFCNSDAIPHRFELFQAVAHLINEGKL